jgi:hypothetical protein
MAQIKWFGESFDAPVYRECKKTDTPAGIKCFYCGEGIGRDDNGYIDGGGSVFHRACFLRLIYGSVAHQLRTCSCFGGGPCTPWPKGMTVRQEAEDAVELHEKLATGEIGEELGELYRRWAIERTL